MKKTITFFASIFVGFLAFGQSSVTLQVDVSYYVMGAVPIDPTGIRVAGNFSLNSGTVAGAPMADWSPTTATSGMTDLGNNIWSLTIDYPAGSVGQLQLYKFVNGNWGNNEGTDPLNTIATAGCGVDDGAGNINRTFEIPASNITLTYCWDNCASVCNVGIVENAITNLAVYPNPVSDAIHVKFNLNDATEAVFTLVDLAGKVIMSKSVNPSITNMIDAATLVGGSYFYTVTAGENTAFGKIIKN